MSRGFTGSDTPEPPPVVAPRAPLPAGVPNNVTPRGLALLRAERASLDAERARWETMDTADADDRARALSVLHQCLAALTPRLTAARLVPIPDPAPDVVRFGASVTVRGETGGEQTFRIVGVDEAEAASGRIAFTSPFARALVGRHAGDTVEVPTGLGRDRVAVVSIAYVPDEEAGASASAAEGIAPSPLGSEAPSDAAVVPVPAAPRRSASGRPSRRKR